MERQTYLEGDEIDYFENRQKEASKAHQATRKVWSYSCGQVDV